MRFSQRFLSSFYFHLIVDALFTDWQLLPAYRKTVIPDVEDVFPSFEKNDFEKVSILFVACLFLLYFFYFVLDLFVLHSALCILYVIAERYNLFFLIYSYLTVFQITIKTLTDQTIVLDVRSTDTIPIVKAKLYEKMGIEPSQQYLVYRGKPLKDDTPMKRNMTLAQLGIGSNAVIHNMHKLKGGFEVHLPHWLVQAGNKNHSLSHHSFKCKKQIKGT